MTSIELEAKSEEEALAIAAERLGVSEDQIKVEVIEENRGVLGLGWSRTLRLRATIKPVSQGLESLIREVISFFGKEVEISTREEEGATWVDIEGEDLGLMIGRHGRTMDALQFLIGIIARRQSLVETRLVLDVEGYRRNRRQEVEKLVNRVVDQVVASQEPEDLRPMNPYERRIAHQVVNDRAGATSESSGEDPDRFVTIYPTETEASGQPD